MSTLNWIRPVYLKLAPGEKGVRPHQWVLWSRLTANKCLVIILFHPWVKVSTHYLSLKDWKAAVWSGLEAAMLRIVKGSPHWENTELYPQGSSKQRVIHHCDGSQAKCHGDHLKGSRFHRASVIVCLHAVVRIKTEPHAVLAQGQDLHLRKSSSVAWRGNLREIKRNTGQR